jgi:Flp pilus assembly protein TadD
MMNRTILKLAASALIIGTVGAATATEVTPKAIKAAEQAADNALAALKKHQMQDAVRYAERAVAYNPSSAQHRALLGQAYLHSGRFNSAETAFTDALRLQPDHGRAALGLALTEIALRKNDQAIAALDTARGRVPDADVGLGLALAGDNAAALAMLEPTARSTDANAKIRQNLALTYALAGRWAEARTTAAQDIAPDQVDPRMVEWARFARPRGSNEQVASLLGVKPVLDGGMPSQLALLEAKPVAAPVALAAVEPQPQPVVAEPAPAPEPVVEVASAPEPAAPVSLIRPVDVPQPVLAPAAAPAPAKPVKVAKPYLVSASATNAPKPAFVKPVVAKPVLVSRPVARGGNFVVQLGAFSSEDRLERGWNNSVSKVSWLKGYTPVSTSFKSPADGRTLHRLAISGFESRIEAVNLCRKVRERGGVCFVRGTAGDAPIQWAKRATKEQFASR